MNPELAQEEAAQHDLLLRSALSDPNVLAAKDARPGESLSPGGDCRPAPLLGFNIAKGLSQFPAQVSETLRAAVVSETGRELLARGWFIRPMTGEGFDPLSTLSLPRQAARRKPSKTAALAAARMALRQAQQQQRATERSRQKAESEAKKAEQLWQKAEQRAEKAPAAATEARDAADAAQREHHRIAQHHASKKE